MKISKTKIKTRIDKIQAILFVPPSGRSSFQGEDELRQELTTLGLLLTLESNIDGEDYKGGFCSKCGAWKGGEYGMNGNGNRGYHICKQRGGYSGSKGIKVIYKKGDAGGAGCQGFGIIHKIGKII